MKQTFLMPLILSAAVGAIGMLPAFATAAEMQVERPGDSLTYAPLECATPDPAPEVAAQVQRLIAPHLGAPPPGALLRPIPVAFHVLHDSQRGNLTDAQIEAQVELLNRGFSGTRYRFTLASIDRTENPPWFHMNLGSGTERQAKAALAIDPARTLNIYTFFSNGWAGWAWFPWDRPEDDFMHGVVIWYKAVTGEGSGVYHGDIIVHETGHYLGAFHTFMGGCDEPGDFVDDTPAEGHYAVSCPEGLDTCPAPGADPIHNYMDYTSDLCRTEFTPGQVARMDAMVDLYRPSLLGPPSGQAPPPGGEARFELHASAPAAGGAARIAFTAPRSAAVRLRIYDAAGRLVRTMADGAFEAGTHVMEWNGRSASGQPVASGVYFCRLEAEAHATTQRLILLRR
jgi:hypothetical protein